MMFFLARSALCIGLVAAAASGVGTGRLTAAIDRGARDAVEGAGRACLASSACLGAGTAALSAATVSPAAALEGGARIAGEALSEPPSRAAVPRRSEARPPRRPAAAGS